MLQLMRRTRGRSLFAMHIAVAECQTTDKIASAQNDSTRVRANNHEKGRIATNKAEPLIGGASIVDSLPCSSLFVPLLQPKAALSGSQTRGGRLRRAAVFLRECSSGT
jgi:hypothetical protein